jgi:hypothetical protein
LTLAYYLKKII